MMTAREWEDAWARYVTYLAAWEKATTRSARRGALLNFRKAENAIWRMDARFAASVLTSQDRA